MTTSWIKTEECKQLEVPAGPGHKEYTWQAQFACQVQVLPHQDWAKLRWGFNAAALFDEFIERQKLFLESQYEIRHQFGSESPDYRTLTFRLINRPREGLLVAILGKVHGRNPTEAMENAELYYNQVKSTFPYDYNLLPARSRQEFNQISGNDILDGSKEDSLAQVKRLEIPLSQVRNSPFMQGLWRSGPRSHEQIWRSLAASPDPLLLNISLRCTVLFEKEREKLLHYTSEISSTQEQSLNQQTLSAMKNWNTRFVERHTVPWGKFFYLQVHLASTRKLSRDLFRTIGTSLTQSGTGDPMPGYQIVFPDSAETHVWQKRLKNLELIFSKSYLPVPRLSEVADLEEVFAAIRLPYSPPENGLPDVNFIVDRIEADQVSTKN